MGFSVKIEFDASLISSTEFDYQFRTLCIGFCPKPRLYGVLETQEKLHNRRGRSPRQLCNFLSDSKHHRAEAWAITSLDYGVHQRSAWLPSYGMLTALMS